MEESVLKELVEFWRVLKQSTNRFINENFPNVSTSMIRVTRYIMEHHHEKITNKDIEVNLSLGKATVSEILNKLESGHIIERVVDENDARKKIIKLCKPKNPDKMDACVKEINEKLTEGISKEELETFINVMDKMKANIRKEMNHD